MTYLEKNTSGDSIRESTLNRVFTLFSLKVRNIELGGGVRYASTTSLSSFSKLGNGSVRVVTFFSWMKSRIGRTMCSVRLLESLSEWFPTMSHSLSRTIPPMFLWPNPEQANIMVWARGTSGSVVFVWARRLDSYHDPYEWVGGGGGWTSNLTWEIEVLRTSPMTMSLISHCGICVFLNNSVARDRRKGPPALSLIWGNILKKDH